MELARRVRKNILLKEVDNLTEKISDFKERINRELIVCFGKSTMPCKLLTKKFWHLMHLINAVMRIKKKKFE